MQNLLIAYATPVFFLLIFLEYGWSRRIDRDVYEFSDSLTSISCGIVTVTLEFFAKAALLLLFAWISAHSVFEWSELSWVTWLVFFFLLDFVYYWAHRWSHEINFLWAVHVPHHQSEEYNLTTALRQGAFQDITHWPLYLSLAVLGCPASVFIVLLTVSKFYQFWIHTRLIDQVPFIEGILNTPSAHRVHHGINDSYIDKNHGGTLMLWDRFFGSYVEEGEEAVFGVRKAYTERNPVLAQFDWIRTMWRDASLSGDWRDRLRIWFMPTGWRPEKTQEREPRAKFALERFRKLMPVLSIAQKRAAFIGFAMAVMLNSVMLLGNGKISWAVQLVLAVLVLASLLKMARAFVQENTV
jgi:alkylglycerol monooxygenase